MPKSKKTNFAAVLINGKMEAIQLKAFKSDHLSSMVNIGIGQSMAPTLLPGDRTELRKIDTVPPLGSIVTFIVGDQLVTHRVIRTEGNRFWARGDNSDAVQGPVGMEDVVGRVVAVVRDGKRIDLTGELERWLGLLRNNGLNAARRLFERFPGLRSFIEDRVIASDSLSKILSGMLGAALGKLVFQEITDPSSKLSLTITFLKPTPRSIPGIEKALASGAIRAFAVKAKNVAIELGWVVLRQEKFRSLGSTWIVHGFSLPLVPKVFAGEKCFFEQLEDFARGERVNTIIVETVMGSRRLQVLLEGLGYLQSPDESISSWPKRLRGMVQKESRPYVKRVRQQA